MNRLCHHAALLVAAILIASCGETTATHETLISVPTPVAQPCVEGERPQQVRPLNEQIGPDAWAVLQPRQKAARIGKQGLDRRSYGENLDAATSACP